MNQSGPTAEAPAPHRPLAGTRVIDLSRIVSGPLCGRLLADLGAEVVKIEPPGGDTTRRVGPEIDGVGAYFAQMNAGKRNVCLDLEAEGAPEVVARLATRADVLIENFRPGVMARFGLDASVLCAVNPRLVYCSITGWGQDGPWAGRKGAAPTIHAEAGATATAAAHRGRPYEHEVQQHADVYSALLASNAVTAALLERAATGRGQHLDLAMAQAAVYVNDWAAVSMHGPTDRFGGFDTWNYHFYPLGDGSHVTILGPLEMTFEAWARALGGEELLRDPRFATPAARSGRVDELVEALGTLTVGFADLAALERALGPGPMVAQVRSLPELAATEWARHRGLMREVSPGNPVPAAPWRSDTSEVGAAPLVRSMGADNRAVLSEAGFSASEVDELYRLGALRELQPARAEVSRRGRPGPL
ncbi:MAG: CaiB/BaiF CoA-transferase family protein [Actinomycetota bacterium]|nr:CaiB/BaiF CoA-transferase family protein [Actinomycetota bacterium]